MQVLDRIAARNDNAGAVQPVLIAFLGDSVTHGCLEVYMDHRDEIGIIYEPDSGYPYRLKRRLDELYPAAAVSILNAGVSGERASDGARRIRRDVLSRRPDLVVLAFALNDSMGDDVETGLCEYRAAMESMIRDTLESGAECIVLTPNPMCAYVRSDVREKTLRDIAEAACIVQNQGILSRYVQAARECAKKHRVPVADAYQVWMQMAAKGVDTTRMLSNAINHPSRQAHDIFLNVLTDVLFNQ